MFITGINNHGWTHLVFHKLSIDETFPLELIVSDTTTPCFLQNLIEQLEEYIKVRDVPNANAYEPNFIYLFDVEGIHWFFYLEKRGSSFYYLSIGKVPDNRSFKGISLEWIARYFDSYNPQSMGRIAKEIREFWRSISSENTESLSESIMNWDHEVFFSSLTQLLRDHIKYPVDILKLVKALKRVTIVKMETQFEDLIA